jgi:hypothetical protein
MITKNRELQSVVMQLLRFIMLGIFLCISNSATAGTMICELEIETLDNSFSTGTNSRVAEELSFETYLYDPMLETLWSNLFAVLPDNTPEDVVILQGENKRVSWPAGTLEMAGLMKIKIKTDESSGLKEIKIKQVDSDDGITQYVSGTGGVNAQVAEGGWHEVEIEYMDNITVSIDGVEVTGFLKELEVELDEDSTASAPVVKEFELKLKASTNLPDVKKGFISSVIVDIPATTVFAVSGTSYEEETDEDPVLLGGHIEAEYEREENTTVEGVLINSLLDGHNDQLKEREGPCTITELGGVGDEDEPGTPGGAG